jgi:hypothetical protein
MFHGAAMDSRDFPRGIAGKVYKWAAVVFALLGLLLLNNDLGPLTRQTNLAAAVLLFILIVLIMPPRGFEARRFWFYTASIATIILIWFLSIASNVSAPTQSYFLAGTIIYLAGVMWFDKNRPESSLPAVLLLTGFLYAIFHLVYDSLPFVKTNFKEALIDADAVVIINPRRHFSDEELQQFENYLKTGGKALILDDPRGHSTANQLLAAFGLRVDPILHDSSAVFCWRNDADSLRFSGKLNGVVNGGAPVVIAEIRESAPIRPVTGPWQMQPVPFGNHLQGGAPSRSPLAASSPNFASNTLVRKPVLSTQKVGKGMIAMMSSSAVFADSEMGFSSTVPNKNMQNIYELEFWIFSKLLELGTREAVDKS